MIGLVQQKRNIQLKLILSHRLVVLRTYQDVLKALTLKGGALPETATHLQISAEYCCLFNTAVYSALA